MASDWNDTILSEPRELTAHTKIFSTTTDGSISISLPTEIYESILDELVEWPLTLRACALVSHLFAQLAQKLLFSCICLKRPTRVPNPALGDESYVRPSIRLFQILSSSLHLAAYVKSLIISDTHSMNRHYTYHENRSWIRSISDNAVHQILPLLTNLEELGLAGNAQKRCLDFLAWGNKLRMATLEQCSSDRLVKIHLAYVRNVPLNLLGLAPRLETLRLKNVLFIWDLNHTTFGRAFDLQEYMKFKEKHSPARLKHLSVTLTDAKEWRACYPWLASHLDLTHIKNLELNIDFNGVDEETVEEARQAILNLLSGCSATLETLRFFMPSTPFDSPNPPQPFEFDVRAMPVLRDLHLSSWIGYASQSTGIPDVPSAAPLPRTALRTLTSIISQALPPNTRNEDEHDKGPTSSSYHPHTQLEAFTLQLLIYDYVGMDSSQSENTEWEEFARVVGELASVGRMSLESEQETMEVDLRSMMGWETMLGEVSSERMWDTVTRMARGAVGATSVIVIISLQVGSDDLVEGLLKKKLGWLREKGVGLAIHAQG